MNFYLLLEDGTKGFLLENSSGDIILEQTGPTGVIPVISYSVVTLSRRRR